MDADTMREFVADIGSEAERLNRMSQKLLMLSRREDSAGPEHEVVDVGDVVSRVFRMLVPLADDRQIDLTGSWKRGCTVLSMEDDVYQIIFNLVENGIKYNQPQGSVHVSLEKTAEDVTISVEDTGFGIPEEALTRIHAPIGLPIQAETPAEIAISVAAELILHRARHAKGEV